MNYINKFQRDILLGENGSQTLIADERHSFLIRHFKICLVFGFGYWKEDYSKVFAYGSHTHNIILPFFRIQYGTMYYLLNTEQNPDVCDATKAQ